MNLSRGEIVLVEVPFHQAEGLKLRPAVVVLDSADEDLLVAPITSRSRTGIHELPIVGWYAAGLNVPSIARIHKIAVVSKRAVRRCIGVLVPDDLDVLQAALRHAFCSLSTGSESLSPA